MENIRRRSVRVLKLHTGFILTKKGEINPKKCLETPLGAVFSFFENFNSSPRVPKL